MRVFASLVLALSLVTLAASRAQQAPLPETPATQPATQPAADDASDSIENQQPQRVILHVNRYTTLAGTVELEDENIIVVRDREGEVHSHPKARLLQIVRLVEPQPGQTGLVVMVDGQVREGVIVEDAYEHVLLEINGIRAKLKRSTVSHVVLQPTVDQRYAEYKESLNPAMPEAHFTLCRWLVDNRRYELARQELEELLSRHDMPEARRLLKLVEAQLVLAQPHKALPDERHGEGEEQRAIEKPERRAGPVNVDDLMPKEIISREDVNIMRVYEIDFEHPPRVSISPDTIRELIEKYGTNDLIPASQTGRTAMFRAAADRPLDVVQLMFNLRARDLYPQIQVNSEPHSLNLFRQRVHDTWLINKCATNSCHGGPFAGRFFLHRRNYKDEKVRYTNLLILERLELDPQWPLVNYDDPENSLIIQYALPRELARKPHPAAAGWKPALGPLNDRLKADAYEWIHAMMQPRPDYTVKYDPPQLGGLAPEPEAEGGRQDR